MAASRSKRDRFAGPQRFLIYHRTPGNDLEQNSPPDVEDPLRTKPESKAGGLDTGYALTVEDGRRRYRHHLRPFWTGNGDVPFQFHYPRPGYVQTDPDQQRYGYGKLNPWKPHSYWEPRTLHGKWSGRSRRSVQPV